MPQGFEAIAALAQSEFDEVGVFIGSGGDGYGSGGHNPSILHYTVHSLI